MTGGFSAGLFTGILTQKMIPSKRTDKRINVNQKPKNFLPTSAASTKQQIRDELQNQNDLWNAIRNKNRPAASSNMNRNQNKNFYKSNLDSSRDCNNAGLFGDSKRLGYNAARSKTPQHIRGKENMRMPAVPMTASKLKKKPSNKSGGTDMYNWSLHPMKKKTNFLYVEGTRKMNGMKQAWHTSAIHERVNACTVKTGSGSLYFLRGKHDLKASIRNGIPKDIATAFARGFPENWKEILSCQMSERTINQTPRVPSSKPCKPLGEIPSNDNVIGERIKGFSTPSVAVKVSKKQEEERDNTESPSKTNRKWTMDEHRILRRTYTMGNTTSANFWEKIASNLPGRTAQECHDKWFTMFQLPLGGTLDRKKSKKSKKKKEKKKLKDEDSNLDECNQKDKAAKPKKQKPAGKNTAKFRQQIREKWEEMEKGHVDDLYESTPFRQKRSEHGADGETFDFDTEICTPQQLGDSDEENDKRNINLEEQLDSRQVDRKNVDSYIAGVAKWRKKGVAKKRKPSTNIHNQQKRRSKNRDTVREEGVVGSITPNGSVKLKVSEESFSNRYEFTDDEDDDEC